MVDLLHPGQRAVGFERSSSEVVALAQAFNEMLERLEHERRESTARALAAQEGERLRIARELHDEIGQTLTAVALRAEHAAARAGDERDDRPEALDELGLANALIALCSRVAAQSGLRVDRRLEGTLPALPPEIELAIYRIAQEALTNAMRHSSASEMSVSLTRADNELVLKVSDNGEGLPEAVRDGGGLTGMRERALLIGAELQIDSQVGAGVAITLRLPLDRYGEHACPRR